MTDLIDPQVPDSGQPGVADATPAANGEVAKATPAQPSQSAVNVDVEAIRRDYETKLAKSAEDLNRLKSSLQSREAQTAKERDDLRRQMQEIRMQGMDATQRKEYEAQLQAEEFNSLQSQLEELNRKTQEQQQVFDAFQFFRQRGVPADSLPLNQGYDALVNSGWAWVDERLKNPAQPQSKEPAPLKSAPSVVTDKSAPATGVSWGDLRAKYGSDENVYSLIEQGVLSPDILPK
jgi:Skp family chaperone for outer membrane proteins